MSRTSPPSIAANYRRVADKLPGGAIASIRAMRDAAIAAFAEKGLPHRRVEEWKYSDLRRVMTEAYAPAESGAEITLADIEEALGEAAQIDAERLVFVDGYFNEALSSIGEMPDGVTLTPLAHALYHPADWVLEALGKINAQEGEVVSLLNTAFMTDGCVLHLPSGAALARPVHLIQVVAGEAPLSAAQRNLVVAEEGAKATLIESYVTVGNAQAQLNSVTEIKVATGAAIRHYKISGENQQTQHLASTFVDLADKTDYLAVNFADGAAFARHQTFLRFGGDDARGHFYGVQLLTGRQHCDMTLVIDHVAVGCESREHVKAVLADHSQGIFQAKVVVRPGAQKTDGRQMAQSLLLSETAEFDAKPELEIYADDVKCNHGATSGAIDDDLMFYLRARGISEEEARSLLIQAFVGEIVDKVENDGLHEALMKRVAYWLG